METNHAWLQNFTWGDLNENNNFEDGKLGTHGYKIVWDDLNENDNLKWKVGTLIIHG